MLLYYGVTISYELVQVFKMQLNFSKVGSIAFITINYWLILFNKAVTDIIYDSKFNMP